MDNADLAALVPGIMTRHPRHTWTARLGEGAVPRLAVTVKPDQLPDRTAKVTIYPGSEVYFLDFEGHTVTDYAYEPDEKPELLQDMLDLAVTVTAGPTQITLDRVGSTVVRSLMLMPENGDSPYNDVRTSYGCGRALFARLRGRKVTRTVTDYPAI